jgi:hypothetical protein
VPGVAASPAALGGGTVTVSVAVPLTGPLLAVVVNVPAAVDAQVVLVPLAGAQVAPLLMDHAGSKPRTPLPNASVPVAVKPWLPPATMLAVAGVTTMFASAPGVTSSVEVAISPA